MILIGTHGWKRSGHACALLACLLLANCQHAPKTTKSSQPQSMKARIMSVQEKKGNPFEKQFNTASAGDRGGMKSFGSKSFHSKDVGGLKSFGGVKSFKTGDFAQAGKQSHMGGETSRYGKQGNRMGGQTFATKDSKFGSKSARQDGQSFQGGDSVFKTSDFQPAKKSLTDNKRVFVAPGERDPAKNANAYAEDDVKRMLNR